MGEKGEQRVVVVGNQGYVDKILICVKHTRLNLTETIFNYGNEGKMELQVTGKQPNSKMCFVCGRENGFGLKGQFYELENEEVLAVFRPADEHQGYPGRLHGGIAATILDETIGRAIMVKYSHDIWGVTVDFSIRYKKPIPLQSEVRARGRITKDSSRMFEGSGEIVFANGTVAIEAVGKYMKMDIRRITDTDFVGESWEVENLPEDPQKVIL